MSQTTLPVHPGFAGLIDPTRRMSEVWDFSHSTETKWLVPTSYAIWAWDEEGRKHRHYKNDRTLIHSADGKHFRNAKAAEVQGYKYSLRLKAMMKESDPAFYGTEVILRYHSTDARADYSVPEDTWKVGFEVEKEDSALRGDVSVWKLFQQTGWVKETDGSLNDYSGFELISPILPLFATKRLRKSLVPVRKYLNGSYSSRCGGHINLSCKGKSSKDVLVALKPGIALLYAIYQNRMSNTYCGARRFERYIQSPDKYNAFYLKNRQVCEIRLFPAVKSEENLIWRIELLKILLWSDTKGFVQKIVRLQDEKSYLYKHLRKVYSPEKIKDICKRAIQHYVGLVDSLSEKESRKLVALGFSVPGSTAYVPSVDEEDYDEEDPMFDEPAMPF